MIRRSARQTKATPVNRVCAAYAEPIIEHRSADAVYALGLGDEALSDDVHRCLISDQERASEVVRLGLDSAISCPFAGLGERRRALMT